MQIDPHEPSLSAPLRLSFDYTRSVGPLLSQFFTALRERRIVGVRGSDGRVHVPPAEFDPVTYERLTEIVPVSSVGTVVSWTWQPQPLEGQPLDRPFAWALIKLDGADTPLLHAIDVGAAGSAESISTGGRVHAHWVDEPVGAITDIAYFALGAQQEPVAEPEGEADDRDPVTVQVTPSAIEIQHTASPEARTAGAQGKLLVGAPVRTGGLLPCREADPATGQQPTIIGRRTGGHLTTFAVCKQPFAQRIKPPPTSRPRSARRCRFAFLHLSRDRRRRRPMGMRVRRYET